MSQSQETVNKAANNSLELLNDKLQTIFDAGDYKALNDFLESLETTNDAENRIIHHYRALAHLYLGHPRKALTYYKKAESFGENIGLLRDLACCYYQLDEIDLWKEYYQKVEQKLRPLEPQLSQTSYCNTAIVLAKFLEEDGQIYEAIQLYEGIMHRENFHKASPLYFQTIPQLLRLACTFKYKTHHISTYYRDLISFHDNKFSQDLRIEIDHSLLLAELNLLGPQHAKFRLLSNLQKNNLINDDQNLFIFDFIEECLSSKIETPLEVINSAKNSESRNLFEEQIYLFLAQHQLDFGNFSSLSKKLSWSCYLRLLDIAIKHEKNLTLKEELQAKLRLIISTLSLESQNIWKGRLGSSLIAHGEQTVEARLDNKEKALFIENKKIDLKRKKSIYSFFDILSHKKEISLDELIEKLWDSTYSPELYQRVRVTAHRMNKLLFPYFDNEKVIEVNAESVTLDPNFILQKHKKDDGSIRASR